MSFPWVEIKMPHNSYTFLISEAATFGAHKGRLVKDLKKINHMLAVLDEHKVSGYFPLLPPPRFQLICTSRKYSFPRYKNFDFCFVNRAFKY